MADITVSDGVNFNGTPLSSGLAQILNADDLQPGDVPSYELCKLIYALHPLGAKLAETPIKLAQSQEREISVPDSPEEALVEAFQDEWKAIGATKIIFNVRVQSRVYGLASVALGTKKTKSSLPVDYNKLFDEEIYFNVLDPLNTSGLIVNQDPNSPGFQKHGDLMVSGQRYHRSRTLTIQNESPIYILWTTSAFAYSGRSVYQRTLYPLKSFLQSMLTDDMIERKVGVLIAKMETPGSIIDRVMGGSYAIKRAFLKQATTDNVVSIGTQESIESLNLQNLDGPHSLARGNIVKNIASGAGMPAKLLSEEAFVEGFGEGTEDAKLIAQFIDNERLELGPVYDWFDNIVQHRAWNPEFYRTIQERFPEQYGDVEYKVAFYRWQKSFKAIWPSLIKEEPSETATIDDIKLKALIAVVQVFAPLVDPMNRALVLQWAQDNLNTHENLFAGSKLELDMDELEFFLEKQQQEQDEAAQATQQGGDAEDAQQLGREENSAPNKPFSGHDSIRRDAAANLVAYLSSPTSWKPRRDKKRAA